MLRLRERGKRRRDGIGERRLGAQSDDGGEVEPELLRLRDGDDADGALSNQLGEAPADGAFADVEGPRYAGVRRTPVLLKDLDDGPVEVIRDTLPSGGSCWLQVVAPTEIPCGRSPFGETRRLKTVYRLGGSRSDAHRPKE